MALQIVRLIQAFYIMVATTSATFLAGEKPWTILLGSKRKRSASGAEALGLLRREARESICKLFWERTHNRQLALDCAAILHGPICTYEASLRRIKARQRGSKFEYQRLSTGNSAVAALKRLQRHGVKGAGYHWAKTWLELPPAAFKAIISAAEGPLSMPIGVAPDPALIVPLLPKALQFASSPRDWTIERDLAVVAILRVYQKLRGRKPKNPKNQDSDALDFIRQIEGRYARLLPEGFGVSRSKGTLHRLIKLATER